MSDKVEDLEKQVKNLMEKNVSLARRNKALVVANISWFNNYERIEKERDELRAWVEKHLPPIGLP